MNPRTFLDRVPADARPAVTALAAASGACVWLGFARWVCYGQYAMGYLGWNLFLAWVPLLCALGFRRALDAAPVPATTAAAARGRRLTGFALGWFFFFPNAPYLVTDLIHLRPRFPVPLWFDAILLAGFASAGLLLGYVSLFLMERPVRRRWGAGAGRAFAVGVMLAASFGVYLGRFERLNSWDLVIRPHRVVWESLRVANPFSPHHSTLGFCLVFSGLLLAGYAILRGLARMDLR